MRLCAPGLRADVPRLVAELAEQGSTAVESLLLPGEFLRVEAGAGLQHLLARYVTDSYACQVATHRSLAGLLLSESSLAVAGCCLLPGWAWHGCGLAAPGPSVSSPCHDMTSTSTAAGRIASALAPIVANLTGS